MLVVKRSTSSMCTSSRFNKLCALHRWGRSRRPVGVGGVDLVTRIDDGAVVGANTHQLLAVEVVLAVGLRLEHVVPGVSE